MFGPSLNAPTLFVAVENELEMFGEIMSSFPITAAPSDQTSNELKSFQRLGRRMG